VPIAGGFRLDAKSALGALAVMGVVCCLGSIAVERRLTAQWEREQQSQFELRKKEEERQRLADRAEAEAEAKREAVAAAKRRSEEQEAALRAAWAAEPRRSAWNAAVYCVEAELKRRAHDPDSIECSDWTNLMKTEFQGQRCWGVRFVYRGKNGLGALVRNEGAAWVVGETVLQLR